MKKIFILSVFVIISSGCSELKDPSFRNISKGILSTTGLGGAGSDSFIDAGFNLAEATRPFSEEERYFLGRGVSAMLLGTYPLYKNPRVTSYVNAVGTVVASASPMPATFKGYRFGVLDSDEINAMSTPGGFIYISRGFLARLPDEDALAAVLAHEVAHVALDHGVSAISQSKITDAFTSAGKGALESQGSFVTQQITSLFGDTVAGMVNTLTTSGYSRSQEYDADKLAVTILARAKYDPSRMAMVLELLKKVEDEQSVEGKGWFSTHPSPDRRKDNLPEESLVALNEQGIPARSARFKAATAKL